MDNEYDGIIIGAGHNGMICAGYLAKAGLKILIVERHLEIGGGMDSHEGARSGFWHNVHSNMHRGVSDLMWYKDLGLAEMGQEYIRLPISVAMLTRDHRAIIWYGNEPEKTAASIGQILRQRRQDLPARSTSSTRKWLARFSPWSNTHRRFRSRRRRPSCRKANPGVCTSSGSLIRSTKSSRSSSRTTRCAGCSRSCR